MMIFNNLIIRLFCVIVLTLSIKICSAQNKENILVSNFSGSFNVTPTGSATYEIGIDVPLGAGEVKPKLSINYSSQNSNSLLGMGFELGGLSQINRVSKTMFYDGQVSIVDFNTEAPKYSGEFSLDGNRLIQIDDYNYRTSIESFAQVVFINDMWRVYDKDGKILEYAFKVDLDGFTISWRLTKVIDVNGNSINYYYTNQNGESLIDSILYTSNDKINLKPYNKIIFNYQKRFDSSYNVFAGFVPKYHSLQNFINHGIQQTQRLKTISSYIDNVLQTKHVFTYTDEISTNINLYSTLSKIELTFPNNKQSTPIHFAWGQDQGFKNIDLNNTDVFDGVLYEKSSITGDFNGDNNSDIIFLSKNYADDKQWKKAHFYISNNNDNLFFFDLKKTLNLEGTTSTFFAMDVNNDNREEIIRHITKKGDDNANEVEVYTYDKQKNTFELMDFPAEFQPKFTPGIGKYFIADFNSDGRGDLINLKEEVKEIVLDKRYNKSDWFECTFCGCRYETIEGASFTDHNLNLFTTNKILNPLSVKDGDGNLIAYPIDFNGDGKSDLFFNNMTARIHSDKRQDFAIHNMNFFKNNPVSIDNGINVKYFYNAEIQTFKTNGINFLNELETQISVNDIESKWGSKALNFADFNGDGKTDIFLSDIGKILYSNGKNYDLSSTIEMIKANFFFYRTNPTSVYSSSSGGYDECHTDEIESKDLVFTMDMNGDGKADILKIIDVYKDTAMELSTWSRCYYHKYLNSIFKIYYSKGVGQFTQPVEVGRFVVNDKFKDIIPGDFNGDSKVDFMIYKNSLILSGNDDTYKVLEIKDGFENTIAINYVSLRDTASGYKIYDDAVYPVSDVYLPFKVVNKVKMESKDKSNNNELQYAYEGLKIHRSGKGLLGFMKFRVTDTQQHTISETRFEIDTIYYSVNPKQVIVQKNNAPFLKETYNNLIKTFGTKRYGVLIKDKITDDYIKNVRNIEHYSFDETLNPIQISVNSVDISDISKPLDIGYSVQNIYYTSKNNYTGVNNKILSTKAKKNVINSLNDYKEKFFEYDSLGNLFREYTAVDTAKSIYDINFYHYNRIGMIDSIQNFVSTLYAYGPIFYNDSIGSKALQRNNCGQDYIAGYGQYIVNEKKHISYISKKAANDSARKDLDSNAQNYVNHTATCTKIFKNLAMEKPFERNNCQRGFKGSKYTLFLPANQFSDTSQEGLQAKINTYFASGQDSSNVHSSCDKLFYNQAMDDIFQTICSDDSIGRAFTYSIKKAIDSSVISQSVADSMARYKLNLWGRQYAYDNAVCLKAYKNVQKDSIFLSNQCDTNSRPRKFQFSVLASTYKDTLSQNFVDSLAMNQIILKGQDKANLEGVCVQLTDYYLNQAVVTEQTCEDNNTRISTHLNQQSTTATYQMLPFCPVVKQENSQTKNLDY